MAKTHEETVLDLIRGTAVLRSRDLAPHRIPRAVLRRLVLQGKIRRIARGLYEPAESDPTEHQDLVEVCKRVPQGVVCLISALDFHGMTTQMPYQVWIAIDVKAYKAKIERPSVRFVRFSGEALDYGVETHDVQGVPLRVTSPAKTVADCFKYRNKVGTDVASEALKEFLRKRKGRRDDLWKAAEVCRVTNVMRPYLEALAEGNGRSRMSPRRSTPNASSWGRSTKVSAYFWKDTSARLESASRWTSASATRSRRSR